MKRDSVEYTINKKKLSRYVIRAKKGNQKALELIANTVSRYIYFYSLTMLGNEDKAEEAVQDILLIIIKNIGSIEKPDAFLGWLKTVTANYCRSKIIRKHEEQNIDDMEIEDDCVQINPEKCIETDEISNIINETVKLLPPLQRESVMMYYFQQMSVSEIANLLDTNENTVKSRLHSARNNLRKILERNGYSELTISGFSPIAYISYSLISEAEKVEKLAVPVPTASGKVFIATVKSTAATTGSLALKIGAIGCAGLVAIGGLGTYAISQSQSDDISVFSDKDEESEVPSETRLKITPDYLYYNSGFTDADLRKEIAFKPEQDLNSKNNKKYILDRMCNSMDFFHTIQATYAYSDWRDNSKTFFYLSYLLDEDSLRSKEVEVDLRGELASYRTLVDGRSYDLMGRLDNKDVKSDTSSADNPKKSKKLISELIEMRKTPMLSELFKTYYVRGIMCETDKSLDYVKNVDVLHRIVYDEEAKEEVIYSRDNLLYTSRASEHHLPHMFVETHDMMNFDNWSVQGIENFLNRECFSIKGKSKGFNNIYSYEMLVDKQTGAMLGLSAYDNNENLIREIVTYEFVVDGIIDDSVYDNSGYASEQIKKRGF